MVFTQATNVPFCKLSMMLVKSADPEGPDIAPELSSTFMMIECSCAVAMKSLIRAAIVALTELFTELTTYPLVDCSIVIVATPADTE